MVSISLGGIRCLWKEQTPAAQKCQISVFSDQLHLQGNAYQVEENKQQHRMGSHRDTSWINKIPPLLLW